MMPSSEITGARGEGMVLARLSGASGSDSVGV